MIFKKILKKIEKQQTNKQLTQIGVGRQMSGSVTWCIYTDQCGRYESFPQSYCTLQNKHMLIVIDLTINSYGEFEFTVKTMNAILLEMFTDHQRVHATYTLSYIGLGQ